MGLDEKNKSKQALAGTTSYERYCSVRGVSEPGQNQGRRRQEHALFERQMDQCTVPGFRLWVQIAGVQRDSTVPDSFTWLCFNSGEYTARSTYDMLCQGRIRISMVDCIWKSQAPLKCKLFSWLTLKHKVWTSDRRARHGLA